MDQPLQFLLQHGYWVVFAVTFVEQIGFPLPAIPVFLMMGFLSRTGHFSIAAVLLLAVLASLLANLIWYQMGRLRGRSVLGLLCRLSLEPDSCVHRAEDMFGRHGSRVLLVGKFIPGLNTAAVPLAGMLGIPLARFCMFDVVGTLLWAGAYSGAGYFFSNQFRTIATAFSRVGIGLFPLLGVLLAAYIAWKYWQRQRFLRRLPTLSGLGRRS